MRKDCFYLGKIAKNLVSKVLAYLDTDEPELYKTWNQCLLNATNTWFHTLKQFAAQNDS
jgi:hypothetical protein